MNGMATKGATNRARIYEGTAAGRVRRSFLIQENS